VRIFAAGKTETVRTHGPILAGALIGLATGIVLGLMSGLLLGRGGPGAAGPTTAEAPAAAPAPEAEASDASVDGSTAPEAAAPVESAEAPEESDLESIQVSIFGVLPTGAASAVVLLLPRDDDEAPSAGEERRFVPIHIGIFEAQAIQRELDGIKPPRPMTHDLLENVIRDLDGEVERVTVTELKGGVYYALIRVRAADGSRRRIDARPSDSMALAVRLGAPLSVTTTVGAQMTEGAVAGPEEEPEEETPTPSVFF